MTNPKPEEDPEAKAADWLFTPEGEAAMAKLEKFLIREGYSPYEGTPDAFELERLRIKDRLWPKEGS